MRVQFKKAIDDQALHMTVGKEYEVIGIEADSYRLVSDSCEPYLYEPEQFDIVNSAQPEFWVSKSGEDGELYAYPIAWFHGCFFERHGENEPGVADSCWKECNRLYGITQNA